ncbi:MAG: Uma2 family endonuclease [Selenomonas sp.]
MHARPAFHCITVVFAIEYRRKRTFKGGRSMDNFVFKEPSRIELVEGKTHLLSYQPYAIQHNRIRLRILSIFEAFLEKMSCIVLDNTDVYLNKDNLYIPDAMIVCNRSILHDDAVYGSPDLVVEVLSPSTAKNDRGPKMRHYAEAGVKEYWIVTPVGKTVEVYYNHNGRFEIDAVYTDFSDHDLELMDDDDRKNVCLEIPVSLYDDFRVKVKDIFVNTDGFQ